MSGKNLSRKSTNSFRVAIVHDFLNQLGGAENVLLDICEVFPKAPVFTLVYDEIATQGLFKNKTIHTSYLQKLPRFLRVQKRKWLLPLCARAAESLDLRGYDLVISDANPWVKGIISPQDTIHISYLHAATRFLWDWKEEYMEDLRLNPLAKILAGHFISRARKWDQLAAMRPDHLLANSHTTAQRIQKYYHKKATVIYPGVRAVDKYRAREKHRDYFFVISRLSAYKKIDLIVKTFNKLGWSLKIAGSGPMENELRRLSHKNIEILGHVSEKDKQKLFENCRGFITLADDDFGITTIEAHAAGRPVLALYAGGARELIREKKNGLFVHDLSWPTLEKALLEFVKIKWNAKKIHDSAQKYSVKNFQTALRKFIDKVATSPSSKTQP